MSERKPGKKIKSKKGANRKKVVLKAVRRQLDPETTERLRAEFRNLPLSHAFMFGEVMRVAEICARFLELLLNVKIHHVEYLSKEHDISDSKTAHGIRVDVYLRDGDGTVYSIEMDTSGSLSVYSRRMRFNQSAIDRNNLKKSEDYTKLPDTYLIVVGKEDFFKKGLALYKRKMLIEGYDDPTGDAGKSVPEFPYEDGTHLYYLNADCAVDNVPAEIGEFLRCIRDNDVNSGHYHSDWMKNVCQRIEEVRDDPAEEAYFMRYNTLIMDERRIAREEGFADGHSKGRSEGFADGHSRGLAEGITALMKTMNMTVQEAMDALSIPADMRSDFAARLG